MAGRQRKVEVEPELDEQDTEVPTSEAADEAALAEDAADSRGEETSPEPESKPAPIKDEKHGWVPSFKIREETDKRRALEAQIARMEERFATLQKTLEPAEPAAPAYEEDPGAHLLHRLKEHEKTLESFRARENEQRKQTTEAQAVSQWAQKFSAEEHAFSQSAAPDYYDAVAYLRESRMKEYQAIGWDPASARAMIDREAIQIGMAVEQMGGSPAERFYELAKVRGWTGKAPAQNDVARTARNMGRATSLGPSGKSPGGKLTLAEIANLPDDEFDKLTEGKKWKTLFK